MKRRWIAAAVLVLLFLSVIALAGCGGDTGQAQEDMKIADATYDAVRARMDTLQANLTPMLAGATTGDFSTLTPDALNAASTDMAAIIAELPKVKAEYQRITELSGVEDYAAYAEAMMVTIDADIAALEAGKKIIDDLVPLIEAGNTAAVTQYFINNSAALTQANELASEAAGAYEDAQAIKTENNLEE
jgi:hypothetical protein